MFFHLLACGRLLPDATRIGPGIELPSLERELLFQPRLELDVQLVPAPGLMPLTN